jgi:hypothetical protein
MIYLFTSKETEEIVAKNKKEPVNLIDESERYLRFISILFLKFILII